MIRQLLTLALVALAPVAAPAEHGRLTLGFAAGGGAVSDVFVGAGLGADGVVQLEPTARLDLSISPSLKASAGLGGSYGAFTSSGFAAGRAAGDLALRLRGDARELALALSGEWTSYTTGAPLDLTALSSPSVTESAAIRGMPSVRLRALETEWQAGVQGGYVVSGATGGGTVHERDLAVLVGGLRPVGPAALGATYRFLRTSGTRQDFSFTAHALLLSGEMRIGPAALRARLQLQQARSDLAVTERLLRASLDATLPLGEGLDLEVTYAYAVNQVGAPAPRSDDRHLLLLGLRARVEAAAW